MGLLSLLWLTARAESPPPPPPAEEPEELVARARKLERISAVQIGAGLLTMVGGACVMTIGRPSGEISTETQAVSDARTVGGAGLLVAGAVSALVGGDTLSRARGLRRQASALEPQVAAPRAPMLIVSGRF